jgi:hypothetical protein
MTMTASEIRSNAHQVHEGNHPIFTPQKSLEATSSGTQRRRRGRKTIVVAAKTSLEDGAIDEQLTGRVRAVLSGATWAPVYARSGAGHAALGLVPWPPGRRPAAASLAICTRERSPSLLKMLLT